MPRGYPHHKQDGKLVSSVYALCGPDDEIRYIGITAKPIEKRLQEHILAAKRGERSYRAHWIMSLKQPPTIIELERTTDRSREKFWIAFCWDNGCRLTNLTAGGEGEHAIGRNFTPEHRAKISAATKGLKRTAEQKEKLRQAKLGTTHTEETKKLISRIGKGRKHREETKAKIAKAHVGIGHSKESREKISAVRKRLIAEGKIIPHRIPCKPETKLKISEALKRRSAKSFRRSSHVQGFLWEA